MIDLRSVVQIEPDSRTVAQRGADRIIVAARESIASRGTFAISLTGGSSPLEMYELLAKDPYRSQIDWSRVQMYWGDDRAVAPERSESNYGAAFERFLRHVPVPPEAIHRMHGELTDVALAAKEYGELLQRNLPGKPTPIFDLLLLGIGNDGHILSLYPQCTEITHPSALVVALMDPPMNPRINRITVTPRFVEVATRVMVIAPGANKAEPLAAMVQGAFDPMNTPAQLVRTAKGEVVILADQAAAAKLTLA